MKFRLARVTSVPLAPRPLCRRRLFGTDAIRMRQLRPFHGTRTRARGPRRACRRRRLPCKWHAWPLVSSAHSSTASVLVIGEVSLGAASALYLLAEVLRPSSQCLICRPTRGSASAAATLFGHRGERRGAAGARRQELHHPVGSVAVALASGLSARQPRWRGTIVSESTSSNFSWRCTRSYEPLRCDAISEPTPRLDPSGGGAL